MSWFKKSEKSHKPSQQLGSLWVPTHIALGSLGLGADLAPDAWPEGLNAEGGSRIVLRDKNEDQRLHAPDVSNPTPREDTVTLPHERDRPLSTPNEQSGDNTIQSKSSRTAERGWKDRALGGAVLVLDLAKGAAEAFGPLKAALETVSIAYDQYKGTVAVGDKIKVLRSRITVLEKLFEKPAGDVAETKRREELLKKLKTIEETLQSLCQKSAPIRFIDHVQDNEDVSGILEDLQEAINDYQMVQQMAIYDQGCKLIDAVKAAVLNNFRCAREAEYRHGSRKNCLKGTRGAVLDGIELWTSNFNKSPVYWLNGLAGTGKSTIAQTTAERMFADGRLGASFFCSRDFEDRSNLRLIFPTLAVQLARKYTEFRSTFVPLVESDPGIAYESLYNQMEKLIVRPLRESTISTVIVIDALDECKDEEPASAILSVLGRFASEVPKVKFFVTGRPEPRIREGFRLPLLAKITDVFVLHEAEPSQVDSDIRLFFRHSFCELARRRHGLEDWPTEEDIDRLCKRAGGLFIYAVATVKFLDHKNNDPRGQLDLLLQSPKSSDLEGDTILKAEITLNSLYTSILEEAFGKDHPRDDPKVRSVLGAVVLAANPLPPSTIAALLRLRTGDIFLRLLSVHSLLILQEIDHPVRPFHKSFPDFITDPTRCMNRRFYISPPDCHRELLIGCLELMNQMLEKNMCKLPDTVTNSEVNDLRERTERYIDHALQYACKSWHKHLIDEPIACTPEITSTLHRFLERKFLPWLELLSVLGAVGDAVDALEVAAKWLEESPTLDLVNDCLRFVTGFFEVISTSAPHIYRSALPLSPKTSIVRTLYGQQTDCCLVRGIQGIPTSWDSSTASTRLPGFVDAAAWSPCNRFIAIAWRSSDKIAILDAVTLKQLSTTCAAHQLGYSVDLTFSPDGRMLTGNSRTATSTNYAVSWDHQTGGLVSGINIGKDAGSYRSMTYSECGTMFGVLFKGARCPTIIAYNVSSGSPVSSHSVKESVANTIWTHGKRLRFATVELRSIVIWEVGFTSSRAPTEVDSLSTPDNFSSDEFLLFPALSRFAFIRRRRVLIWDARRLKNLLDSGDVKNPRNMTFSPDGRFFICGTKGPDVYLWKESPDGYLLHRKFISSTGPTKQVISPDGALIVAFYGSTIQLWRTTDPPTPPSTTPAQASHHTPENFVLEFSPDKKLAAVTRRLSNTVTVLDLKAGNPRLVIDTGMEVYAMRIAGSTIAVADGGKVVTWDVPVGGRALCTRANANDSVRTTTLEGSVSPGLGLYISISPDLNYIAAKWLLEYPYIYDTHTGKLIVVARDGGGSVMKSTVGFALDRRGIWCDADEGVDRWEITEDGSSGITKLDYLGSTEEPIGGFPWRSPCGCQVTDDGWILTSRGKRLLWLPHHWRSDEREMAWGGNFFALLRGGLPEAVVLELEV